MNNINTTFLYKHYDKNGVLLYVGISLNHLHRLAQHRGGSFWFNDISRIDIEPYESREMALKAERDAIINNKPLHNIAKLSAEEHRKALEESIKDLERRMVRFNPLYSISDVSQILSIGISKIKRWMESGELGWVPIGERITKHGKKVNKRITGWQLIDFLEYLESANKK